MSQVLSSSSGLSFPTRPTTTTTTKPPEALFTTKPIEEEDNLDAIELLPEIKIKATDLGLLTSSSDETCPSHCQCSCPQVKINERLDPSKKVNLDITLLPCARTAAYQLELAIKLCRKKK